MIGRVTVVVALSTGLLVGPRPANAAPAGGENTTTEAADPKIERAKELLQNGASLYNEGSYEAAILAFQEGYDLSSKPAFLYNIGNAYERLGDFEEARRYLDQYRAYAPEDEREILARRISALDERLRKQREEAAQEPDEPVVEDPKPIESPPQEPAPVVDDGPKKPRLYGPAAMALTGVAAVGLGLGIGFGLKANKDREKALQGCVEGDGTFLCQNSSQDALAARRTSAIVADVGFAVAGAAAIGVIAVVAIAAKKRKAPKSDDVANRRTFAPYASGQGAGFVLRGRF